MRKSTRLPLMILASCWLVHRQDAQGMPVLDPAVVEQAIAWRHSIHQHPELSNREVHTAQLVATALTQMGYAVQSGVGHTGVVAILEGGKPGPIVAARADMDALPITEQTDLPFRSMVKTTYLGQEVGVTHACGHDIHTSVLLGVAAVLARQRQSLPGTVKLIFQGAEEGPPPGERGGAELMREQGALDHPRPQAIFALHSFPDLPVGEVGYSVGPAFAASDQFTLIVKGRPAHGAFPQLAKDPIVMAAAIVSSWQSIVARNVDPQDAAVLTVGMIRGGTRYNIIPETVELQGTVRTLKAGVQALMEQRMREMAAGLTQAHGGTFTFDYQRNNPATINDPTLARWAEKSLVEAVGTQHVHELPPTMGAEDFAYFAQAIPGFYFRLGVHKPGTKTGGLHTPTFRGDDSAIEVGIRTMGGLLLSYLHTKPATGQPSAQIRGFPGNPG